MIAIRTMDKSALKFLLDIKNSISLIEEFCVDVPNFSRYSRDAKTKSAVERQLQIISGAIHELRHDSSFAQAPNAQQLIHLENEMSFSEPVDDQMIWNTLRTHLPQLKKEIASLLKHED